MSNNKLHQIGVFDSGVGGLTVMQQLINKLPHEPIVYFGDTARTPYGNKSRETIIRYSIENSIFLLEKNIKVLVVACNTATAHAIDKLHQIFHIPVVGVIEPAVENTVAVTQNQRIAILGTRGTINSGVYQREILKRLPNAMLFPVACPLFVPLVEENWLDHSVAKLIVKEYLYPLRSHNIDTLLLGCTHYPLLRHFIQEEVGEHVKIIDPAASCADKVFSLLNGQNLQAPLSISPSQYQYFVSDDRDRFCVLGKSFLGNAIHHDSVHLTSSH